jgi:hypothetical protein
MSTISNDELSIKVTVDLNEAEKKLQSVEATLDSTAKASEDAGKSFSIFGKSATELNQGLELVTKASKLAFEAIGFLTTSAIELIDRGERVGSLAEGFEKLGGTSEAIDKASAASKGLVANSDLLAIANKALVSGLPNVNENFELIAGAGAKLANTLGIDTTQAVEQLTQAIASGRDMQLRQLGVQVESEIAYKKYAESIGKATDALTENEKKTAIQIEAIEQLKKVNNDLADVTDSASNAKLRLQNTIQNLVDEVAISINSNEDLAKAFNEVELAIKEVDVEQLISGLAKVIEITVSLGRVTADVIGTVIFGYQQLKQVIDEISFNKATEQVQKFNDSTEEIGKRLKSVNQAIKEVSNIQDLKKLENDFWKLTQAINSTDKGAELYGDTLKKLQIKIKEIDKDNLQQIATFEKVTTATGENIKVNKELEKQHKKQSEDLKKLEEAFFKATNDGLTPFEKKLKELIQANPERDIKDLKDEITELAEEALKAGEEIGGISSAIEKIPKIKKEGGGFFDGLFGDFDSSVAEGFGQKIGEDIATSISTALSDVLKIAFEGGNSEDYKKAGEGVGGAIGAALGTAIGTYFGGPVGGAIGSAVGEAIGTKIGGGISGLADAISSGDQSDIRKALKSLNKLAPYGAAGLEFIPGFDADDTIDLVTFGLIGGKDKQANARKALEDFFDDAIKEAKKKGFLKNVFTEDDFSLILGRDAFTPFINEAGEASTAVTEKFKEVPENIKEFFADFAPALAELLQVTDLDLGQFVELLAVNFDGANASLNDLQVTLQSAGITLEQFEAALEEAYLKGDIGAKEYLASLEATRDLMEQGIPGAVGAIDQAMNNLVNNGLKSGAAAMDALGDIAAEAAEAGITNFDDLRKRMLELGYSVEDVDKFFQALAANNITTMEQLSKVTAEQSAGIVSFLEDVGFGFKKLEDDIKTLKKELDEIKSKEINIKVNFQTNFDNLNKGEKDLINGNTGEGGG